MNGHWLALYTFGQFRTRADHPVVEPFHQAEPLVWAAMERAEGFVARSGYEDEPGPDSWGEQIFPDTGRTMATAGPPPPSRFGKTWNQRLPPSTEGRTPRS